MNVRTLPPRECAPDAPPLPPIRLFRQPPPQPSRAEIIAGRCALAVCAALTLMMIAQFVRAWWMAWL